MADDGDGPLKLEDVAGEVIKLRKDLTKLKRRCSKCRHRTKIGFETAAVGGSLADCAHPQDEEPTEPDELAKGTGRPS